MGVKGRRGTFDVFEEELRNSRNDQTELASGSFSSFEDILAEIAKRIVVTLTVDVAKSLWDWLKRTFGTKKD